MQSFAFWYKKNEKITENGKSLSAILNFNLWSECWNDISYFDIGLKVKNISLAKSVCVYVPFKVEEKEISDLSDNFRNSVLTSAIFNENYTTPNDTKNKIIPVTNEDTKQIDFYVYELKSENDDNSKFLKCENKLGGCIITIDNIKKMNFTTEMNGKEIYFRFRIAKKTFPVLLNEHKSKFWAFQSISSKIYDIDFRCMDKRSMNSDLLSEINNGEGSKKIDITALHFLLITKTYVDVSQDAGKGRKLEEKIWNDYVMCPVSSAKRPTDDLIAYHYCQKASEEKKEKLDKIEKYFVKYSVEKSLIWIYILVSVFIGAGGSALWSLILVLIKFLKHNK